MRGYPGTPGVCPVNACQDIMSAELKLLTELNKQFENDVFSSSEKYSTERPEISAQNVAPKPIVAFSAGLAKSNFTTYKDMPTVVVFDEVVLNESKGNGFTRGGYSTISGAFVAQTKGFYTKNMTFSS